MKELIVVRHAKSDWGNASLDDHDRPLNRRGQTTAPKMARLLADTLQKTDRADIDAMVSSTALRAKTTAGLFARELGFPESELMLTQRAYLASSSEWLRLLSAVEEEFQRVVIFGHNPGLHMLVDELLGESHEIHHLPTAAVVRIQLNCEYWGGIGPGEGELMQCLIPREVL